MLSRILNILTLFFQNILFIAYDTVIVYLYVKLLLSAAYYFYKVFYLAIVLIFPGARGIWSCGSRILEQSRSVLGWVDGWFCGELAAKVVLEILTFWEWSHWVYSNMRLFQSHWILKSLWNRRYNVRDAKVQLAWICTFHFKCITLWGICLHFVICVFFENWFWLKHCHTSKTDFTLAERLDVCKSTGSERSSH